MKDPSNVLLTNHTRSWCRLGWVPLLCVVMAVFGIYIGAHPVPFILAAEYFPTNIRSQVGVGYFKIFAFRLWSFETLTLALLFSYSHSFSTFLSPSSFHLFAPRLLWCVAVLQSSQCFSLSSSSLLHHLCLCYLLALHFHWVVQLLGTYLLSLH